MQRTKTYSFLLLTILLSLEVAAQSLPVGSVGLEDYFRRQQLCGKLDSSISFAIRPLNTDVLLGTDTNFLIARRAVTGSNILASPADNGLKLLPVSWQQQFNSHHAYGWNDGPLIPAKGYQTLFTAGISGKYGPLTFQLKPEAVLAANTSFEEFPADHYGIIWKFYYNYYNHIDLPVRFGKSSYSRVSPGQSSIKLNYKAISFGLSTENLWWGPGIRNSLLMSNSAPGFPHLTLNTNKPFKTSIGTFEGQLIAGQLHDSGFTPPDTSRTYLGTTLYVPKPGNRRYLSGIILSFQPKPVPGLFVGFSRTSQRYYKDLQSLGDYLPFFSFFKKYQGDEPEGSPDQYISLFARWLWKEVNAEVYFEYGNNAYGNSFTDFLKDTQLGRAYIFGLRKLVPLARHDNSNMLISFELTQLSQNSPDIVRNAGGWYVDENIRHGYTHRGEMLGAGIGPGANHQSLEVSWVKGFKTMGLQLERYLHNNDFYYYAYEPSGDFRRHYTDISLSAIANRDYKNFIINGRVDYIKSLNYGYYLLQTGDDYFIKGRDASNLQLQLGITYVFDNK